MSKQPTTTNPPKKARSATSGTNTVSSLTINTSRKDIDSANNTMADQVPKDDVAISNASQPTEETNDNHVEPATKAKADESKSKTVTKQRCCRAKHKIRKAKAKAAKSTKVLSDESASGSSSEDDSSSEEDTESSSSEEERSKRIAKKAKKLKIKKAKGKKKRTITEESSSSSSDSDSSSEDDSRSRKKKTLRKSKKLAEVSSEEESDPAGDETTIEALQAKRDELRLEIAQRMSKANRSSSKKERSSSSKQKTKDKKSKKSTSVYHRVDQVWDSEIHNFKLRDSNEADESDFNDYAWLVRRCFSWENKPSGTVVDIKSPQLRTVLLKVMKDCKSVALEAKEPVIDPNLLFLYLEDLRAYCKTLKKKTNKQKKRKAIKNLEQQRSLCKAMVAYIDEDYADTKKTLYPLLKAGNITFELLWALFKPNEVAVTSTYGIWDDPRCFKVEYANKCSSMSRGEWYCIEGRYLEYDGKSFGFGEFEVDVDAFQGPRKITSLATYPLRYHKDPDGIRKKIIERGQAFVSLTGMQYKSHKGLAFMKKKKQVLKISTNSRVMVDPSCFRRINPNYPISLLKPKEDAEDLYGPVDDSDDCSCCDSEDEPAFGASEDLENMNKDYDDTPKYKYKWTESEDGPKFVAVEVDENGDPIRGERLRRTDGPDFSGRQFTEDELLLTTSVVLGFAFSEKLWLEFTISGLKEIQWNDKAFDSLVLPQNQKDIVRALVESHKFSAAKTIDDVVVGKGRGLVALLHGAPGIGKTLTAEGISELLRCPLYMVSAGELGTDPGKLEFELQRILDIAHSWGAVLLLDEADVFLEKREVHDIHRNALVSIFLRLLEYFQGILFLTTNRVETFDDAFASRIHVALRYGALTHAAKITVWKMFLDLVRKSDEAQIASFSDADLETLARHDLNGRQIKNTVRTAQALALNEKVVMAMSHVRRVLDVSDAFTRDLKGGTGYEDAMRCYQ